jgi:hypothetical protein
MNDNKFGSCSISCARAIFSFSLIGMWSLSTLNNQFANSQILKMFKPNACFVITSIYVDHNNYLQREVQFF